MGERAAGDVGEDLLHDGVVAVLPFGLEQLERRIGEDRVVVPDWEQLVLPGLRLLAQVADPADDQPGSDRLALVQLTIRRLRNYTASQLLASWFDLQNTAARLGHGGGGATTFRHYADPVSEVDRRAAAHLA